jgi:hypothetical protein
MQARIMGLEIPELERLSLVTTEKRKDSDAEQLTPLHRHGFEAFLPQPSGTCTPVEDMRLARSLMMLSCVVCSGGNAEGWVEAVGRSRHNNKIHICKHKLHNWLAEKPCILLSSMLISFFFLVDSNLLFSSSLLSALMLPFCCAMGVSRCFLNTKTGDY